MKTIEELVTELLFADDCAFLAHTEEALQHIVNCFSDAAKNYGLTISLRRLRCCTALNTSTKGVQSSHTSIDGTNLT